MEVDRLFQILELSTCIQEITLINFLKLSYSSFLNSTWDKTDTNTFVQINFKKYSMA